MLKCMSVTVASTLTKAVSARDQATIMLPRAAASSGSWSRLSMSRNSMAKIPKVREVESEFTQKEAEERRDAIIKRVLSTPPRPRKKKPEHERKGDPKK